MNISSLMLLSLSGSVLQDQKIILRRETTAEIWDTIVMYSRSWEQVQYKGLKPVRPFAVTSFHGHVGTDPLSGQVLSSGKAAKGDSRHPGLVDPCGGHCIRALLYVFFELESTPDQPVEAIRPACMDSGGPHVSFESSFVTLGGRHPPQAEP